MELSQVEYKVKQIAGVVCAIEGLAWTLMSLFCIILYNYAAGDIDINIRRYWNLVIFVIYSTFIFDDTPIFSNQTVTGSVFTGFMWIHFLLNVLWTVMSLLILRTQTTSQRLTAWSLLTLTICAWDFVTASILGVDYKNCMSGASNNKYMTFKQMMCTNGILPVVVIAAKGFVLWIMNLCFGFTLLLATRRLKKIKMTRELS
ncbi:uncharacterized protein [Tenebrio molitor]|uniref:uncharacterized protein n=1 Tax=Tenebrio molitor TaxID=7067 RepID=UPI0036247987